MQKNRIKQHLRQKKCPARQLAAENRDYFRNKKINGTLKTNGTLKKQRYWPFETHACAPAPSFLHITEELICPVNPFDRTLLFAPKV